MDRLTPTLERLVRLPLFRNCTVRQLALIVNRTTTVHARAGDVLMREGAIGRELVMIVEGSADVFVDGEHINTLGPGEVCGEMALLDVPVIVLTGQSSEATAIAAANLAVAGYLVKPFAVAELRRSVADAVAVRLGRAATGTPEVPPLRASTIQGEITLLAADPAASASLFER